MGFDTRDIRPSMDVYTLDNAYLGTVLRVLPGPASSPGERVGADARQSSAVLGELFGPAPTLPIGNKAPRRQSAHEEYRTQPDGAAPIGDGRILVGKWWGLKERREIPLREVLTVSHERVVLRSTARQLRQPQEQ